MNRDDFKSGLTDLDLAISAQGLAADQDELGPPEGAEGVQVASVGGQAAGRWVAKLFGKERAKLYGRDPRALVKNKPDKATGHTTSEDAMDALTRYKGDKTQTTQPIDAEGGATLPVIESEDELTSLIEAAGSAKFPDQRSWAEVKARTDTVAKVMEELKPITEGRQGGVLSDVQLHGVSRIVSTSFKDVERLMAKVAAGTDTPEDLIKLANAKGTYEVMHSYLQGQSSEVGRALNSLKMTGDALTDQNFAAYEKMTAGEQGGEWVNELKQWTDAIAKRVEKGDTLGKAMGSVHSLIKNDKIKMAVEFWKNNQLSGITTHAVNFASVAGHLAYEKAMVRPLAAGIGAIRKGVVGGEQPIQGDEIVAPYYSAYVGLRGFVGLGWDNLKSGHSAFNAVDKVEDSGALKNFIDSLPMSDTSKKVADYASSASFKLLTATDEAWRAVGFTQEMYGLASRQASKEGLRGDLHVARMNEILDDPPFAMYDQALTSAKQMTFTDLEDRGWIAATSKALRVMVGEIPPLQFIIPYINTPSNLLRVGMEMSPLAPVSKRLREDIAAGGVKADIAMAKMTMGMGMGVMFWQAVESGVLSGSGPDDFAAQELLKADGWQPWAIQGENQVWTMERMDPFTKGAKFTESLGFFLGEMDKAKYAATDEDKEDAFARGILYLVSGVMEDQWMEQASSFIKVLEGQETFDKYIARTGAGFVPYHALASSINKFGQQGRPQLTQDSIESSILGMMEDQIKGNFPDLGQPNQHFVRPKRNWDGEVHRPLQTDFAAGASPWGPIELNYDPMSAELFEHGVTPSEPSPILTIEGKSFSLQTLDESGRLYDEYLKSVGKMRREIVKEVIADSAYQDAKTEFAEGPNSYAARELNKAMAEGKKAGEGMFLEGILATMKKYPEIQNDLNMRFAAQGIDSIADVIEEAILEPEKSELKGPVVGQPPRQRFEYPIPEMK